MNSKKVIPVILVLLQSITVYAQKVTFTYDENGNRINRTLTVERLQSNSVTFPVINPKGLNSSEDAKAKGFEEGTFSQSANSNGFADSAKEIVNLREGGIVTNVYPNPNKGLIKIEISNMPLNSDREMRLYDVYGTELISKRNFDSYSELDISRFKDGLYILRIKLNNSVFDWKIVKSHN